MSGGEDKVLRVVDIIEGTSVDGPGLRTSIYFAGCEHRCPGCHNPDTWPFDAGQDMKISQIMDIVIANDFNVTFSGGDPLYQIDSLLLLAREIKGIGKSIWCYTGFIYEDIARSESLSPLLKVVDVLVDGPYIEALKNPDLRFRGSSNQRIIDCSASTMQEVVEWKNNLSD